MPESLNLGAKPNISIQSVGDDLNLIAWENEEILIKVPDDDNFTSQQEENNLVLSCSDRLALNVPEEASVKVDRVEGDLSVRGLKGNLEVNFAVGDVSLRNVGRVLIETIGSDLHIRSTKGDIDVTSIGGDASINGVNGNVHLSHVKDDLAILDVRGNLTVDVADDVVAHLAPQPDEEYSIVAGDGIMLVLPENANATLTLNADKISVNFPGVALDNSNSQLVTLGEGQAKVNLNAGTHLLISTHASAAESADEFSNFAGMMFDWGSWGQEVGEYWENYGREMGERISQRVQESVHHAERKLRQRVTGRRNTKMKLARGLDEVARKTRREPVSEEERMAILRMLAQKVITAEEAEQLLSALEGD